MWNPTPWKSLPGRAPFRKPAFTTCCLILIAGAAAAGDATPGLSAEQIIERSLQARGGVERLRSLQAIRLVGTIESAGTSGSFSMTITAAGQYRSDIDLGGNRRTLVSDGRQAWRIEDGGEVVTPLQDKAAALFFEERCDPLGPLAGAGCQDDYRLELAGEVEIDGIGCHHLLVHLPSGRTQEWFIDRQTWLPVQRLVPAWLEWFGDHQAVIWYFDFSEHEGVLMPMLMERETAETFVRSYRVETVELDPELEPRFFTAPAPQPQPE